jgi:hypothetical protein
VDGTLVPDGGIALIRFAGESERWCLGFAPDRPHEPAMPPDRSPAWRELPPAILESAVFGRALGLDTDTLHRHVDFTHDATAAIAAIEDGTAQIAFLLPAPSVGDLIAVAEAGDRMPPKSTYFFPKVPAGLVIYDFALSGTR